jgi:hypothetical protein
MDVVSPETAEIANARPLKKLRELPKYKGVLSQVA